MSTLLQQAERIKLARVLGCDASDLGALAACEESELRAARAVASNALFGRHRGLFAKLASATRLLPTGLSAQFTQKFIGPTLSGRVASEMEPKQALALADKLPVPFLASVCLSLDPGRSGPIIRAMPAARVVDVAKELQRNGEHIVMAQFADALSDAVVAAVMEAIDAPSDLLRIGFYIESKTRLETIIAGMDDERLGQALVAAQAESLWPQALAMVDGTSDTLRGRMANLIAAQSEDVIGGAFSAAQQQALWPMMADAVMLMSPDSRQRIASVLEDANAEWKEALQSALSAQGASDELIAELAA